MKGYTIQHSIELLEKKVGSESGGARTAADVTYDNTSSGLTADDVQEAIDELDGSVDTINTTLLSLAGQHNISSTETQIGTLGGDPLYAKTFEASLTTDNIIVNAQIYSGDVRDIIPTDAKAPVCVTVSSGVYYVGGASVKSSDNWVTTVITLYQQTSTTIKGIAFYTKEAPSNTRSKKK